MSSPENPNAETSKALHVSSKGEDEFANPGFEEHSYRMTDTEPEAAKRSERHVAILFSVSIVGTLLFIVSYFVFTPGSSMSSIRLSTLMLGIGTGIAFFAVGIAAIHWAKTLMPDRELSEDRHTLAGTDEDQSVAQEIFKQGKEESGIARRSLIRNSMIAALALAPLPAILVFRDLGPLPKGVMHHSMWKKGVRLAKDTGGVPENPSLIKASDVTLGSVFHVIPEDLHTSDQPLDDKAKAAVTVMRLKPDELQVSKGREDWNYNGIVAYSLICTHVGCPVALYEHHTHHLLCPCHQSTFDVTRECEVIFGPAKRPLPQLPITVDSEGYLVARSDFHAPVGPSYWEMNH